MARAGMGVFEIGCVTVFVCLCVCVCVLFVGMLMYARLYVYLRDWRMAMIGSRLTLSTARRFLPN